MTYQDYEITLSNGTIVNASESYETPEGQMDLVEQYASGDDDELFVLGDRFFGMTFVLWKNIVSIRQTGVRKERD